MKVVCVNDSYKNFDGFGGYITIGKIYDDQQSTRYDDMYIIRDNSGHLEESLKVRYITLEEHRLRQLDKLLLNETV
jgi:hypothetical protein